MEFNVLESFKLTDRGTAIVIGSYTEQLVGSPINVVLGCAGEVLFKGQAYKEYMLRRSEEKEYEALVLKDYFNSNIPENAKLRIV